MRSRLDFAIRISDLVGPGAHRRETDRQLGSLSGLAPHLNKAVKTPSPTNLPMNLIGLISVSALGAALAAGNFSGWRDMSWGD
jgi:hypothetical protein